MKQSAPGLELRLALALLLGAASVQLLAVHILAIQSIHSAAGGVGVLKIDKAEALGGALIILCRRWGLQIKGRIKQQPKLRIS